MRDTMSTVERPERPVRVNAAIGQGWDMIGDVLERSGVGDSSGLRRFVAELLNAGETERAARAMLCDKAEAEALRAELANKGFFA